MYARKRRLTDCASCKQCSASICTNMLLDSNSIPHNCVCSVQRVTQSYTHAHTQRGPRCSLCSCVVVAVGVLVSLSQHVIIFCECVCSVYVYADICSRGLRGDALMLVRWFVLPLGAHEKRMREYITITLERVFCRVRALVSRRRCSHCLSLELNIPALLAARLFAHVRFGRERFFVQLNALIALLHEQRA